MYNTTNIKAILFDMDGTVLESEGLFAKAEHQVLIDYGIQVDISDLNMFRGMPEEIFYIEFKKRYNLSEDKLILQKKIKKNLYKLYKTTLAYVDGFEDFYKKYVTSANRKTALVTNTSIDIVEEVRSAINISEYFAHIITSTDVSEPKPSAIPYAVAMRALGVKSGECIILEDSSSGLLSGVRSGAQVFGIKTTLSTAQIHAISPKIIVVKDYKELSEYLD